MKHAVFPPLIPPKQENKVPGQIDTLVNKFIKENNLLSQMNIDEGAAKTVEYLTTLQTENKKMVVQR